MTAVAEADVPAVAALLADRARNAMLHVLLDGTERPSGELARAAGVAAATASGHLRRLVGAGLLTVRPAGRHRYYRLAGPGVAAALESLAVIAPPIPVRSLRASSAANAMAEARTCYDHLAGRAGVELHAGLLRGGVVAPIGGGDYRLTQVGRGWLLDLEVDPETVLRKRRLFARDCLDWTERRPHLAGALPAAVLERFLALGWFARRPGDRGLNVLEPQWAERCGLPSSGVTDLERTSA